MLTISRKTRVAVLAVLGLLASPAWAGSSSSYQQTFFAHLDGFDRRGCLQWSLGTDAPFNAVINVRTGKYTGCARGKVTNQSRFFQFAWDVGQIYGLTIGHSWYTVDWCGNAWFTACGDVFDSGIPN